MVLEPYGPVFYAIVADTSTTSSDPATSRLTLLCNGQAVAVFLRQWKASQK